MSLPDIAPKPPTDKPLLVVHQQRRDGKHKVEYCFMARRIVKLLTAEKLQSEIASEHYRVRLR